MLSMVKGDSADTLGSVLWLLVSGVRVFAKLSWSFPDWVAERLIRNTRQPLTFSLQSPDFALGRGN